jgi:hypothetical protein
VGLGVVCATPASGANAKTAIPLIAEPRAATEYGRLKNITAYPHHHAEHFKLLERKNTDILKKV